MTDLTYFITPEKIEELRGRFARQQYPKQFDPRDQDRDRITVIAFENCFFYLVNEGAKCFRSNKDIMDEVIKIDLDFPVKDYKQAYPVMILEVNDRYFISSIQQGCLFVFEYRKNRPHLFNTFCLTAAPDSEISIARFIADGQAGKQWDRAIIAIVILINTWLYRCQTNPDAWMFPRQRERNLRAERGYRDIQLIVPKQEIPLYVQHASEVVRPGIGAGCEKSPHSRRAHDRRLRDKEGNVLKTIPVRECRIHPDRGDWGSSTVEYRPDETNHT